MKAPAWPIEPWTTISIPFIEIPQRAEALPLITSRPPRPLAPADWLASPATTTFPDIMFSATPTPQLPAIRTRRQLVHPGAVVADVPVDLDLGLGVEADRDRVGAVRVADQPAARPGASRSWRRWFSSRTPLADEVDGLGGDPGRAHATLARCQE